MEVLFERHCQRINARSLSDQPFHLILANVEHHSGPLIEFLESEFHWLINRLPELQPLPLVISTTDEKVAHAFTELLPARTLPVPAITPERKEDIPALVQHFLFRAQLKKKESSPAKAHGERAQVASNTRVAREYSADSRCGHGVRPWWAPHESRIHH